MIKLATPSPAMPARSILLSILCIILNTAAFGQIRQEDVTPLGYGLKLGGNYTTIGSKYADYGGVVSGSIGMFFGKPINNRLSWFIEPAFSSANFREQETDNRFNASFLDASGFVYLYPSAHNTDFAFIGGLRPSYMLAYSSEVFTGGKYLRRDLDKNKNSSGQIDLGAMVGVSVALSPVINFELLYNYSVTNKNTTSEVKGRPSTVEFNLRLNALELKKSLDGNSRSSRELVEYYSKGVLLVMLSTPQPSDVKRLRKEGKTEEINILENELMERNMKVVNTFSNGFKFCPVYYFMDTSVYTLVSGSTKGIFVNKNLQADTAIKLPDSTHFFVAGFCEDVSDYTKRKHFGLFVYDEKMNQLDKPFNHPNQLASPVFEYVVVRANENKLGRPSYNTVPFEKLLGKLNTRLFRYLN
jgi:hypothetical protein